MADGARVGSKRSAVALLEVRGLAKSYVAAQALWNGDLGVEAGSVHALLGEHGAGSRR